MKTTQSQIEAKIQEIREDANEPSNFLFKKRTDLDDKDWIKRELKNARLTYGIIMFPSVMLIAITIMAFLFLKYKIYETPISASAIIGYLLGLLSLIQYANRFEIKREKLKQALYLLELKQEIQVN